jgi:hypothetical protein
MLFFIFLIIAGDAEDSEILSIGIGEVFLLVAVLIWL